eukprot:Tamp_07331.p1 GENE.Tamp_07331~~Tamp_07331.p1  ORF type:complete len:744 (-),score=213.43 Tamp_07331:291-2393(-)
MPAAGSELHEYRLHSPGCLWRHRRYVQRPFQLFFAEAQNEWSERIRQTLEIGMGDSLVEKRRALLADETLQYKELYATLMSRVFEYPDAELHNEQREVRQLGRLLYRGHQAWHLAHIIISHMSRPARSTRDAQHYDLPFDLVHWLQEHTPADVFNVNSNQPFIGHEPNDDWWGSLCNFVMHLYIDQAVAMLEELKGEHKCGEDGQQMAEVLGDLLNKMRKMEDMVDQNLDITHSWRDWKALPLWQTLENLIRNRRSPICSQVDAMLKILQGQEEAISQHAKSWSQAVVARMMFGRQEAVLGVADLASYTDDALNTHQSDPEEAVVVDLMRLDVQGAVQNFFTELHDWWSAAHLADVLYRGNYLPFSQQFAADMRSFAVRNYIDILLASNGMWEVAIAYCKGLVDCDVAMDRQSQMNVGSSRYQLRRDEMAHYAHYIVSRQRIRSDRKCRRLLHACPENLTSLRVQDTLMFSDEEIGRTCGMAANSIKAAWGMVLFSKHQPAAALYWLSQAESELVPQLAKQSLQRLVKLHSSASLAGGDEHDLESLLQYVEENPAEDVREVREVQLIRDYIRLERLLKRVHATDHRTSAAPSPDASLAASLLRQLLQPGLGSKEAAAPRGLRRKLLAHTVALIEMDNNLVFSSSDIFLFMQALQDMELSYKNTGETKAGAQEEDRMELQKIRLALARGLAKAFQAPPPLH